MKQASEKFSYDIAGRRVWISLHGIPDFEGWDVTASDEPTEVLHYSVMVQVDGVKTTNTDHHSLHGARHAFMVEVNKYIGELVA